jgi:choline dehydrogenase-like flavoprotein
MNQSQLQRNALQLCQVFSNMSCMREGKELYSQTVIVLLIEYNFSPMSFPGIEGVAFVNTKYADPSGLWPDVQFHFGPSSINSDGGMHIRKITNLKDQVYNTVYKPLENSETWTILPLLLRPKSSGWVRLQSRNPFVQPMIEPNYFAYKEDIAVLTEGIKIAMNVSNTPAFQRFGSRPHVIPFPECRHLPLFTDVYWECSMRQFTFVSVLLIEYKFM